ncbi:alkaline phosphatase D family protein [Magnetovibrio sp.]|uniref:alkaline phosphatase D family protein n=1 Tax=Magnetovibrio sp. TaxID=2024836 RepID=UPI002F920FE1
MATITLGPIIGKVTHDSARILIETASKATVTLKAVGADHSGEPLSHTLKAKTVQPYTLTGLRPDTLYTLEIDGANCPVQGSFKTLPQNPERLNFGFLSCNKPWSLNDDPTDQWAYLFDSHVNTRKIDILLHLGDQVYADRTFKKAMRYLANRPAARRDTPPNATESNMILSMYRDEYRDNWTEPGTRQVLANVSNLMIWDDHEVRDGWGGKPQDHDPNHPAFHIGTLARQVYREYQRQLWADDDPTVPSSTYEDHMHVFGTIGVLMTDQRGGRQLDDSSPYLGAAQWRRIEQALSPGGLFANTTALVVATPVPLVYYNTTQIKKLRKYSDNVEDHWSWPPHAAEQLRMLKCLAKWKAADSRRILQVIGGDVHLASNTSVMRNGKEIFRQTVASPITNLPNIAPLYGVIKSNLKKSAKIAGKFTCKHENLVAVRNYGVLNVKAPTQGSASFKSRLVFPERA